jgi:hypothetical protein
MNAVEIAVGQNKNKNKEETPLMAGYMLCMCNTHSIGQDFSSCIHIHSAAGRGGRVGHNK